MTYKYIYTLKSFTIDQPGNKYIYNTLPVIYNELNTQIILQNKWILNKHRKPSLFYCLLRRGFCVSLGRMPPRGSDTGARGAGDPGEEAVGQYQPP